MILSDGDLRALHNDVYDREEHGIIEPWNPLHLQPGSIDLTLGDQVQYLGEDAPRTVVGHLVIHPGVFVLGTTAESVKVPCTHCADVKGRSSWARKGLMVECAGFIDPGFGGQVTLELKNISQRTLRIPVGARVCQIRYQLMTSPAERPYGSPGLGSHYQGQTGVTTSALVD